MKLIVVILGYHNPIYEKYIEVVKKTWGDFKNENIQIIYSYGGHHTNELIDDTVYVTSKDFGEENTYDKLLNVFDVVYKNLDFDVILKTSNNSYFRLDLTYKILKSYELHNFYGSSHDSHLDKGCFHGVSMLLSKDVVKKILDIKHIDNPYTKWDDTGIEYLLKQIYPNYIQNYKDFKRLDISENNLFRLCDPLFKLKYDDIWAFRCKTSQNGIVNRDLDIKKIELLHKIYS